MKIQLLPLREAQTVAFKEEMQEAFQHGFDFQSSLLTLGRADTSIVLPSLNRSFESYYKDDNQMTNEREQSQACLNYAERGGIRRSQWQVLPDKDFYQSLEAEGAEAYEAIDTDGQRVGGAIITANGNMGEPMEQREQSDACISSAESRQRKTVGQLAFLYVKVGVQSKGIGQSIWKAIEALHPEIEVWETCTPYFDRRNIHFYINRCGFHAVEFFNEHHPDPNMPEQFDQEDGLFKFEKRII